MPALAEIHKQHARRVAALDPLLPPLPCPEPGEDDQVLWAEAGGMRAAGVARTTQLPDCDGRRLWGAARSHVLTVRSDGDGDGAGAALAWESLLGQWEQALASRASPSEWDEAARVRIASRDDDGVRALVAHHFGAVVSTAVRRRGVPIPPAPQPRGVRIRSLRALDAEPLLDLVVALHAWDTRYGAVTQRSDARDLCAPLAQEALSLPPELALVAETPDGELVGLVTVEPPGPEAWFAGSAQGPCAYLGMMYVAPGRRSQGLGSALVGRALAAADALEGPSRAETIILDHCLTNPVSTPFWHRHGFRPLWTTWQRRPVLV